MILGAIESVSSEISDEAIIVSKKEREGKILPDNDSNKPMDAAFLLAQVGGSAETAALVLEEFINQVPLDVGNIENLLTAGDLAAAGKVAHSLKGSSGVFGANQLRQIAADLEMACRGNEAEKANELFAQLKSEAQRCLDFIPELKNSLK
ncbi:MAG: Hpt domain-containing protein [Planctomycetaceae bacterium]|nr:Hpt domain-containing protein [Planctomycetaceae bacterium]